MFYLKALSDIKFIEKSSVWKCFSCSLRVLSVHVTYGEADESAGTDQRTEVGDEVEETKMCSNMVITWRQLCLCHRISPLSFLNRCVHIRVSFISTHTHTHRNVVTHLDCNTHQGLAGETSRAERSVSRPSRNGWEGALEIYVGPLCLLKISARVSLQLNLILSYSVQFSCSPRSPFP